MNVANFPENLQLMQQTGFTLTDLESALIENSLTILQSDNKFNEIFFFGRIETSGPGFYYIAFGYGCDILKERKFFYSLNAYEWVLMPPFRPKLWNIARNARSFFRGDPAHVEEVCMVNFKLLSLSWFLMAFHLSAAKIHPRRRRSLPRLSSLTEKDQGRRSLSLRCSFDDVRLRNRSARRFVPSAKPLRHFQSLLPRIDSS